ncbi:hypothetical protein [uncultured Marinobacter sp.]|uniref:hypothetical protein n=1 Tax=uncultured Marinobacter sp. TaxID=187379 RepID=UPI002582BCB4|nr:hypothetical protein [uncultured Marinobacter sp.]
MNIENKADSVAAQSAYLANGSLAVFGLTFNQAIGLAGLVLGIATFAFNVWMQKRRDERETELHLKRMEQASRDDSSSSDSNSCQN